MPFFVDSGGFLASIGRIQYSDLPYLIKYYTDYIHETCSNPMYDDMVYFYLDIVPSNGITPKDSLENMNKFHNILKEKVKDLPGALNKMYLVLQVNNEISYDTFYHFIRDNSIHEQLQSHKWSCGGMVPLNFNQYSIRPYMVALFDILDLELTNLKNNIPVYFHILGTSAYYEMIFVAWMNILCEYYNIPLIITFDSTTHISNATRSGILHYINEDDENEPYITCIATKYKDIYNNVKNRGLGHNNLYYINKIKESLKKELVFRDENDSWFDNNYRWTKVANNSMAVYETWAFSKIFNHIYNKCYEKRDLIINQEKHPDLKGLIVDIMNEIDGDFNPNRKSFARNIVDPLVNSLDLFDNALNNKLDKRLKSYNLVQTLFHNNTVLATDSVIKLKIEE